MDGRLVNFGYWCGALPELKVDGRLLFVSETSDDNLGYRMRIEDQSLMHPLLLNPCIGSYLLQAQEPTYDFLVSCASTVWEPQKEQYATDLAASDAKVDRYFSVIARSTRLDYSAQDTVDWAYLQSLLKASMDEALDDLWHIRRNADFWLLRMQQHRRSGRTYNLLRSAFGRIDVFHTLYQQMNAKVDHPTNAPLHEIDWLTDVISMHAAFLSVLDQVLRSMQKYLWPTQDDYSTTLPCLFDLMKKNDPILRVMGVHAVLRTMERELQEHDKDKIPFIVMQAFNDIAVVAVCSRETEKHYNFVSYTAVESGDKLIEEGTKWTRRDRPWLAIVEHTLQGLDSKMNKLDTVITDATMSLQQQHFSF